MLKLLQGFKDFILRGNVIDLAVGIVIGAAFTSLVGSFTQSFIEPLIRVFGGGTTASSGSFQIRGQSFNWASFLNAAITFVLVAAVLYFPDEPPRRPAQDRRRTAAAGTERGGTAADRNP